MEGVLLRPLPFPDSSQLVVLSDRIQGVEFGGNGEAGVTVPDIRAYTRDTLRLQPSADIKTRAMNSQALVSPRR